MKMLLVGYKPVVGLLGRLKIPMSGISRRDLATIGDILYKDVVSHFKDSGSDVGGWAAITESTRKRRKYKNKKVLIQTEELMRGHQKQIGARSVHLKPTSGYLEPLHFGDRNKPARQIYYMSQDAEEKIVAIPLRSIDAVLRSNK